MRQWFAAPRCAIAGACVALSATALEAGGQTPRVVQGVVLDGANRPVESAAVLAPGVGSAITDDSGRFRLEIPHRDRVALDVRRIGFLPSRVGLGAGGDTTVSLLMLPRTQELPTVEVNSTRSKPPTLAGFEQRMSERKRGAGTGKFITADDIAKLNVSRMTQIVDNVPSIFVRRVGGNNQRFAIFGRGTTGSECAATIYLDGIRLPNGGDPAVDRRGRSIGIKDSGAPIDDYVGPLEIAGIEVYARGMLAPPQFQAGLNPDQKCAIVAIWTKFS